MFLSLSPTVQGLIMALMLLGLSSLIIALIFYMIDKNNKGRITSLFLLLLVTVIDWVGLRELNLYLKTDYVWELSLLSTGLNEIPSVIQIAWGFGVIILSAVMILLLHRENKNKINGFSIKEALENLPTGIAFVSMDHRLYLSNRVMDHLYHHLTGKSLHSSEDLWEVLQSIRRQDDCVIDGEAPAFLMPGGEVWQFTKTTYPREGYYQLKAIDITDLYRLSENTGKINKKLWEQQQRLIELSHIVEHSTKEQVVTHMKVNFHDHFGNLLTLTKKTLKETPDIDEAKTLMTYWENLTEVISNLSSQNNHPLILEDILHFGTKLGCQITTEGELPHEDVHRTTILLCINEMLKNAYRHGTAEKINVKIEHTKDGIHVTIFNEDPNPPLEIKEGGGLLGLRQRIEQKGGTFEISTVGGITMKVVLYQESNGRKTDV